MLESELEEAARKIVLQINKTMRKWDSSRMGKRPVPFRRFGEDSVYENIGDFLRGKNDWAKDCSNN